MDPRLSERILKGMGLQMGPAVDTSAKDAAVEIAANDFARQKAAENIQSGLNLGLARLVNQKDIATRGLTQRGEQFGQNLDFSKDKFNQNLAFDKDVFSKNLGLTQDEMQYNRRAGDTATAISALGLGVEGLGRYKESQRQQQLKTMRNGLIEKYKGLGTDAGNFYARMVELMGV